MPDQPGQLDQVLAEKADQADDVVTAAVYRLAKTGQRRAQAVIGVACGAVIGNVLDCAQQGLVMAGHLQLADIELTFLQDMQQVQYPGRIQGADLPGVDAAETAVCQRLAGLLHGPGIGQCPTAVQVQCAVGSKPGVWQWIGGSLTHPASITAVCP